MYTMLLLTVLAQPPKKEDPKTPLPEPSKLGPANTAFPDLKLPAPANGRDRDYATYRKEFDELLFKRCLPGLPKDATLIQKVQYEQLREGLAYLQTIKEIIDLGRWDSATFKDYLSALSDVYLLAAQLQSTTADRVRCYETRILSLKDAEQFIKNRVDAGNQPPQDLSLIRFHRLQAEADLLKLKDSLKDKK